MNERIVVLASGGFDSALVLKHYSDRGFDVFPMYVDYGQKSRDAEVHMLSTQLATFNINNDLMVVNTEIPWAEGGIFDGEGHLYVEMRNLIFLSFAISYAESLKAGTVAYGAIKAFENDEAYPDTQPAFVNDMHVLSVRSTDIKVEAPFIFLTKDDVISLGRSVGIKVEDTISCTNPVGLRACGQCEDCKGISRMLAKIDRAKNACK